MFKVGDKVELNYTPDDLRYDVEMGDVGVVTELLPPERSKWNVVVKWYRYEPPMTHKPEELRLAGEVVDADWVDKHSVNCYFCGELVDERDCIPADEYNNNDGGDICPDCLAEIQRRDEKNGVYPDKWDISN